MESVDEATRDAAAVMAERSCNGGFQSTSLQRAARHGDASLVALALECSATNLDAVAGQINEW